MNPRTTFRPSTILLQPLVQAYVFIGGIFLTVATAWAGVPFVTDDPGTPEAGHFEINVAGQYTHFQGEAFGTIPSVEVNYGVTDQLQVTVMTPLAFSQVAGIGANFGFGDAEVGIKYRFIEADDWGWRPAVAFAPTLVMPSGIKARGLGDGHFQASLPIWLSKEFNQWTVFGGASFNVNSGPDQRNWWYTGVGVTYEINESWTVGAEIYHATPTERGLTDSTAFNLGVIYNISDHHHLMMSAGRNLTNAKQNNEFSTYVGYQLTF